MPVLLRVSQGYFFDGGVCMSNEHDVFTSQVPLYATEIDQCDDWFTGT